MKTIKLTVRHGNTNETATATGATVHEAITALKSQQRLGGYVIDNTREAYPAFAATLETSGRAQHGWGDYEIVQEDAPDHTNPLKYEPLFSRLTWGNGTCAEFIGDKDTADKLGAEMVVRWNSQEPDIHTRKAWAAIERQNAEIKALRDAFDSINRALSTPPLMTREAQEGFSYHSAEEAYRVELCRLIIATRDTARAALEGGAK